MEETNTSVGELPANPLSPREQAVLRLVAQGLTTNGIAHRLGISRTTVDKYVTSILAKLHAANRTEAAAIALRRGWLS